MLMKEVVHEEEIATLDAHRAQAFKFIRAVINANTVMEYLPVNIK